MELILDCNLLFSGPGSEDCHRLYIGFVITDMDSIALTKLRTSTRFLSRVQ